MQKNLEPSFLSSKTGRGFECFSGKYRLLITCTSEYSLNFLEREKIKRKIRDNREKEKKKSSIALSSDYEMNLEIVCHKGKVCCPMDSGPGWISLIFTPRPESTASTTGRKSQL